MISDQQSTHLILMFQRFYCFLEVVSHSCKDRYIYTLNRMYPVTLLSFCTSHLQDTWELEDTHCTFEAVGIQVLTQEAQPSLSTPFYLFSSGTIYNDFYISVVEFWRPVEFWSPGLSYSSGIFFFLF